MCCDLPVKLSIDPSFHPFLHANLFIFPSILHPFVFTLMTSSYHLVLSCARHFLEGQTYCVVWTSVHSCQTMGWLVVTVAGRTWSRLLEDKGYRQFAPCVCLYHCRDCHTLCVSWLTCYQSRFLNCLLCEAMTVFQEETDIHRIVYDWDAVLGGSSYLFPEGVSGLFRFCSL